MALGDRNVAEEVRPLVAADWDLVADIYREGIGTGDATFETTVPAWDVWDASRLVTCRLALEVDGVLCGFAALSPVSRRPVYAGVAEVMIYVAAASRGRGLGRRLMQELVRSSEEAGVWTLQASIFPENAASIALHLGAGFRMVGVRERLGRSADGRWRNVMLLERRSQIIANE